MSRANNPRARGLGRGLGALIRQDGSGLLEVDVDRIAPNPRQPRYVLDEAALGELADSIRQHGILQPLIVTRGEGEGYLLVAGERRWRAAREAGLRTVPVVVKEVTPRQRLELALVENLQRQDLTPLEEAAAYRQLVAEHGLTQDAVAARVGKSRVAVANALRLLHLAPVVREALLGGRITAGHARALLGCSDEASQERLLAQVLGADLSVRATEELVRRSASAPRSRPATAPPAEVAALEQQLRQSLGTKVQLQHSRRGGRIVIHYYSEDELQGLFERLTGGS
jgi:ParB family chromosome partitioning protein